MKALIIIISSFLILSCASHEDKIHSQKDSQISREANINDSLRQLFLTNANQINAICDSIITSNNANDKNQKDKSVWMSTTTVFTEYAPNIFGKIAAKSGDSSKCIIVEVTVYNEKNSYNPRNPKNTIFISAEDSSCAKKLNNLNLKLDSTERFIYGVNKNASR